jgi:hypothetical protein
MAEQNGTVRGEPTTPAAPRVALRTYTALRIGMVAVLMGLGVSLFLEIRGAPEHCVNKSISAYYYTPVHSVFVGALIALSLAMIALWGKTVAEDACLNLAGMLAPVVAFVPTLDSTNCSLPPELKEQTDEDRKQELIAANSDEVSNNFNTFLTVLLAVLVFIVIAGGVLRWRQLRDEGRSSRNALKALSWFPIACLTAFPRAIVRGIRRWRQLRGEGESRRRAAKDVFSEARPVSEAWGYVVTWLFAFGLWLFGLIRYNTDRDWFNREAHWTSAVAMFVFVGLAVLAAGISKLREGSWGWMSLYLGLAVGMIVAYLLYLREDWPTWVDNHRIFLLEAAEIFLLAVFWAVQTVDRLHDRAPAVPRRWV